MSDKRLVITKRRICTGKILYVVTDVRENSTTFGKSFSCILSEENKKKLFIPKGFLHSFATLENDKKLSSFRFFSSLLFDFYIKNLKSL